MMGMPFQGVATMGFDNQTQTFQGTWMDSFTTATMFMTGKMEGDKLVMRGEMKDPTNGKVIKEKQVVTHPSNDKMVDEFFHEIDGKEVPVMSIVYTRAVKSAITPVGEKDEAARAKDEMMKKMKEEMEKKMKGNMPGH